MPIFSDAASPGGGYVDIFGFAVAISKWTAIAADDATVRISLPTYGAFAIDNRVRVADCFVGSTVVGMSYARLALVPGVPGADIDVDDAGAIAGRGDRVLIGVYTDAACTTGGIFWIWAGYVTRIELNIDGHNEGWVWRCMGPEWLWGEGAGAGASRVFAGQLRRSGTADDTWAADPLVTQTPDTDLLALNAEIAVFNPGGRKNMSKGEISYATGGTPIIGRVWEIPDRKIAGVEVAERWSIHEALKFCVTVRNDPAKSGIAHPAWATTVLATIPADDILRDTTVEGLGLWAALREICGERYGAWVDCRPSSMAWGGFTLKFFSRSGDGAASLYLNPRGTDPVVATPSVNRLHLTADIQKTVNKCRVFGRSLYHVSLRYMGGLTSANAAKVNLLQHGWTKAEGDLSAYSGQTNPNYDAGSADPAKAGRYEVTDFTIDTRGQSETWRKKYTTAGQEFEQNRHVFRLFVWNEAAEWRENAGVANNQPWYYTPANTNGAAFNWVRPNVKALWGGVPDHVRRRRPLTDGKWTGSTVDSYQRIRPQLFAAIVKPDTTLGPWYKIETSKWKLDEQRAAVWITADDLSVWQPFDDEKNEALNLPNDGRSFATLIYQGVLRLALEGCVEGDDFKLADPALPADSGSPFYRETSIRSGAELIKMQEFNGGDGFVLAAPGTLIDDTAEAVKMADQYLDAGKDAQIHSSIFVECDWPRQAIGKTIGTIAGRNVPMRAGQSALTGRPAQIVGFRMDCEAFKWELMTESAALAAKAATRKAQQRETARRAQQRRAAGSRAATVRQTSGGPTVTTPRGYDGRP